MKSRPAILLSNREAVRDLKTAPGVYALYREGRPVYVGKAKSLHGRVFKNHCGRGVSMTGSALRRNVAEHLGVATANDIKTRAYSPTSADAAAVNAWIAGCELRTIDCATEDDALKLEAKFKAEWKPRLTKQ